jgi:hypothetical protein
MKNLIHYGDMLAIFGFMFLIKYFSSIKNKTFFEYFLFVFSICGFIIDIYFTFLFLMYKSSWV